MNTKPDPEAISQEDIDNEIDWGTLDSRVSTAIGEIQSALEEALAATRELSHWVEHLHGLSAFIRQVESGLAQVRHQLKGPAQGRRSSPVPSTAPEAEPPEANEPWPLEPAEAGAEEDEEPPVTALEVLESEGGAEAPEAVAVVEAEEAEVPVEGEPSEGAPAVEAEEAEAPVEGEPPEALAVVEAEEAEPLVEGEPSEGAPAVAGGSLHFQIQSSEANIDLMVVERALRETPGVADVDLLDYAGRRARVKVTLSGGEEAADAERLAADVQERLAKLTWDSSLSVSPTE